MNITELQVLLQHNYWATKRILKASAALTHEQYVAPNTYPSQSLHGTLVHALGAEWIWLRRFRDGVSERAMLKASQIETLAGVTERWAEIEIQYVSFAKTISSAALDQPIHYQNDAGQAFTTILWQILQHVAMHGMQHRAECAQMLTDFGHSPGNLDLIVYLRSL